MLEVRRRIPHFDGAMLDNVVDINYYAVDKAKNSNLRHRPVGMGIMGFQDCLHKMRVSYASDAAVEFADRSMEAVCYYAYWASTELARERGKYSSYKGSLWDQGILPKDSLELLRQRIFARELEPGSWIDEVKIAEAYGISRTPMREALKVKIEPMTIDGVKAYMLTPAVIPPQNKNRLLIHVHGGCYVSGPGESGTPEATMMAGFGGFRVLSVDYRMPPDHPYPPRLMTR